MVAVAGVTNLRVGDRVCGIAPGCLGAAVLVPADLMVPLPPHATFVEGCTAPIVYCTVFKALEPVLADLRGKQVPACSATGSFRTSSFSLRVKRCSRSTCACVFVSCSVVAVKFCSTL